VDWGSGTIVYGLLNGKVNIYDYWSKFKNGLTMDETEYFEKSLLPQNPIFVVPAAGKETFPETRKHFFEIAADRGWDLVRFSEIRGQSGDVLYELYSVTDVKEP
jgi:hypothetical protein